MGDNGQVEKQGLRCRKETEVAANFVATSRILRRRCIAYRVIHFLGGRTCLTNFVYVCRVKRAAAGCFSASYRRSWRHNFVESSEAQTGRLANSGVWTGLEKGHRAHHELPELGFRPVLRQLRASSVGEVANWMPGILAGDETELDG